MSDGFALRPITDEDRAHMEAAIRGRLANTGGVYGPLVEVDRVAAQAADAALLVTRQILTTHGLWPMKHEIARLRDSIKALRASNSNLRGERSTHAKRATHMENERNYWRNMWKARGGGLSSGELFALAIRKVIEEAEA